MIDWIVNGAGLGLMALIVWWFWLWQPRRARRATGDPVEIIVDDGVYDPAWIETPAGQPLTLRFLRKDPSPCAEQVIFQDLGVSEELPVGEYRDVTLTPREPGTYRFTCQMQMYQGQLRVTTA